MKIGKLSFGKRYTKAKDFKWFYCPMSKEMKKRYFYFFWWFGHNFYIALNK